jgi:type IV pilus assembly protein PilY1
MKKTLAWILIVFLAWGGHVPRPRADDSDIFGQNIQPNVMIVLDSSGSMNDDIGTPVAYNASTTYCSPVASDCPGTYTAGYVYKVQGNNLSLYAQCIVPVTGCTGVSSSSAQTALSSVGHWQGKISGNNISLVTGNYENYLTCGSCDGTEPKLTIAKRVIDNLVSNVEGVRFGVMKFENNSNQTNPAGRGAIVAEIGATVSTITTAVNNISASGYTPLGEQMDDVDRYYKHTAMRNGTTHPDPIQYECQPNFAIVISDGMYNGNIDPKTIATTLKTTDHSTTFTGTQNVLVHTVGFSIDANESASAVATLQTMANNGGGQFYNTNNSTQLEEALEDAIRQILAATFSFATPVVPTTGTSGIDNAYLAAFQSDPSTRFWKGYIKSYQRDTTTGLIPVDSSGIPLSSALVWEGGAKLSSASASGRTIYTNVSGVRQAFTKTNSAITQALLNASSSTEHDKIIDFIRGVDSYDSDGDSNTTEERSWKLGDIFHSTPVLITKPPLESLDTTYNTFKSNNASRTAVLLAGSNDGMIHAFKETNGVDSTADGTELWGFIPSDQLGNLKSLTVNSSDHVYYNDASIIAADICTSTTTNGTGNCSSASNWKTIAIFGERRGGKNYNAIDVTDTTSPAILWTSPFTDSKMGETWSDPAIGKVKMSDGSGKWVAFVGGGYDTATNNNSGKVFFAIDLASGAKLWEYYKSGSPTDDKQYMNFSLAANPTAIDIDNDGFIDYVYIADVGGQVWKFSVEPSGGTTLSSGLASNWTGKRIFAAASSQTNPPPAGEYYPTQGMYAAPAIAFDASNNLWVFIGSGDRNHPNNTSSNRFYGFKDVPTSMTNGAALTESDLTNLSSGTGTVTNGWYIPLATSEKVLAQAEIFNGVVLFTTFTPTSQVTCSSGGGDAKLYSANMTTGDAALNLANAATLSPGNAVTDNGASIGTGIPSKPVVVMQMGTTTISSWAITGTTNQQITNTPLQSVPLKQVVGWREVF